MEFVNNGGAIKLRIGDTYNCYWKTIRKGEIVEMSAENGKRLGLTEVKDQKPIITSGQLNNKKVETKQIDFLKELTNIKGIGVETAKDIIRVFPKSEDLKNKIHKMETLPFRENICLALKKRYSK